MSASVGCAIAPQLERADIKLAQRKQTERLDAYDYYLRAVACFHKRTKEATDEALPMLYKSMALDPNYAAAYGLTAWTYAWRQINGWMADRPQEIGRASGRARVVEYV